MESQSEFEMVVPTHHQSVFVCSHMRAARQSGKSDEYQVTGMEEILCRGDKQTSDGPIMVNRLASSSLLLRYSVTVSAFCRFFKCQSKVNARCTKSFDAGKHEVISPSCQIRSMCLVSRSEMRGCATAREKLNGERSPLHISSGSLFALGDTASTALQIAAIQHDSLFVLFFCCLVLLFYPSVDCARRFD